MRTGLLFLAVPVMAASLAGGVTAASASSQEPQGQWHSFGDGTWQKGAGIGDGFALVTTSDGSYSYGGADLKKIASPIPQDYSALSFDFVADQSGASGGSPRMHVGFSDGHSADLRPLSWTAGQWTHVDGMSGTNWDNNGGSCGSLYGTDWSTVVACHPGAQVTSIAVINDSGWLYPSGERVVVQNLSVVASPEKNPRSEWHAFSDAAWNDTAGNGGPGLVTSSDGSGAYGGAFRTHLETTNPSDYSVLSYDFVANQTGSSGGSPRMHVAFSDGGSADLRPVSWTADQWTHVDGMTGTNWDNYGGSCGFTYGTDWSTVVACHTGATVTGISVVNDSGWLYASGEQVVVDNLRAR
jgi:hypothetical protein